MRCLVTGATGFIGSFLVEHLLGEGCETFALARQSEPARERLPAGVHVIEGAIEDAAACVRAIAESQPDRVYHLAAQSYPTLSWQDPVRTYRANLLGTVHILEAVRARRHRPDVVLACSSAEYALRSDGGAIREEDALGPSSPYGVSKLAADFTGALYAQRYGMRVMRVRPFFIIGPRKVGDVCCDFARRIVHAERAGDARMRVGDLAIVRDFLDVADAVKALTCVADCGTTEEAYNICSGRGRSIAEVLQTLKALAHAEIREETDPALIRPIDERVKIGDPARLLALGWRPAVAFEESLGRILAYWRQADAEAP